MLILIDGYNATMNCADMAGFSKERQRDVLVATLKASGRSRLGSGKVFVVFDAHGQVVPSADDDGPVRIVYADDADNEIARRAARGGRACTVVTNDMRLRARLSQDVGRHLTYLDTAVIFSDTSSRPARRNRSGGADEPAGNDKGMSRADRRALEEELLREWDPDAAGEE